MHLYRSLYYFAVAAQFAAFAFPAVMAWRGWDYRKGIAIGWAVIVIFVQSAAVLGFLYPGAFGLTKDQVHSPDAPDILPTALMALILSAIAFALGKVARLIVKRN